MKILVMSGVSRLMTSSMEDYKKKNSNQKKQIKQIDECPSFKALGGQRIMTINEASEKYSIPIKILKEYESWGLCGEVKKVMGMWQYDDTDLERLSMIMTLHDIGFSKEEIECYMRLLLEQDDAKTECLKMLEKKRNNTLDEIHYKEKQLDRMDYLRHEMRKADRIK